MLSDTIDVDIWAKFVRLTVFSGMTSICRLPIGPIREDPALSAMMEAAWLESLAVARAKGVPLTDATLGGMRAMADRLPPTARSSMLEDLERGRRLELPWLSGAMVRFADALGVPVPTHRLFVTLLTPHVHGRPVPGT